MGIIKGWLKQRVYKSMPLRISCPLQSRVAPASATSTTPWPYFPTFATCDITPSDVTNPTPGALSINVWLSKDTGTVAYRLGSQVTTPQILLSSTFVSYRTNTFFESSCFTHPAASPSWVTGSQDNDSSVNICDFPRSSNRPKRPSCKAQKSSCKVQSEVHQMSCNLQVISSFH